MRFLHSLPPLLLLLNLLNRCWDCHRVDFGQEVGDCVRVAHMDVVDGRSSSRENQAPLQQAAGCGRAFLLHLVETDLQENCESILKKQICSTQWFWNAESVSGVYSGPFWSSGPGSCGQTGWRLLCGLRPISLVPSGGTGMRWPAPTGPAETAGNQWRRARGGSDAPRSLLLSRPCRTQSPLGGVSDLTRCSCEGTKQKCTQN